MANDLFGKIVNTVGDVSTLGADRLLSKDGLTGIVHDAEGQNDYQPGLHTLDPANPDADNPVMAAYNAQKANYDKQVVWSQMSGQPPPTPPVAPTQQEIAQGQIQGDRARLLGNASNYNQLVGQLQQSAAGNGPSAALDTLREGNARANANGYGMAASANVAPGQRAALFNAAINQTGANNQQAARDAAVMRANETNTARAALGTTLGQQNTPLQALYAGSQERDLANQNAGIQQDNARAGIAASNAQQKGETVRDGMGAFAKVAGGAGA